MSQAARSHSHTSEVAGGEEVAASGQGVAGAQLAVTLAGAVGKTTFLTYFIVSTAPVAAVVSGLVTVTGVVGGPLNYILTETVSAGGWIQHPFRPPLPATAANTDITVTLAAIGGGAASAIVLTGWQA